MALFLVSTSYRGGYLHCKYQGDLNRHDNKNSDINAIFQLCRKHACMKILVDCLEVDYKNLSITDEHALAIFISSIYPNHFKIAVLTREITDRPNRHLENVCTNRGLDLRVFFEHENEEAVLWLKGFS